MKLKWSLKYVVNPMELLVPYDSLEKGNLNSCAAPNGFCGWGLDFPTRRKRRKRPRQRTILLSPLPPRCLYFLPDVRAITDQLMKRLRITEPHRGKATTPSTTPLVSVNFQGFTSSKLLKASKNRNGLSNKGFTLENPAHLGGQTLSNLKERKTVTRHQ